jgi:RHS repeat-associated protein
MKQLSWSLVLALFLALLVSRRSEGAGGVGTDNPAGVTGEYYGSITTGGSYDPNTGNAKRFVDDLTVTGSIGAYPLKWTRVMNSRGGTGKFGDGSGWRHNYQWALTLPPTSGPTPLPCEPEVPAGNVSYPDGGVMNLYMESPNTYYQRDGAEPMGDRLFHVAGEDYDLRLKDGGRVEFRTVNGVARVPNRILDPHNQPTTLEYDSLKRLWKITEPGGRYLLIHYHTYLPEPEHPAAREVIEKVEVWSGPQGHLVETVQYHYFREDVEAWLDVRFYYLREARYDDGSHATYYNYPASEFEPYNPRSLAAGKVKTCEDVRYAGAMRNIKYTYKAPTVSQTHPVGWGQIESERNMTTDVEVSKVSYPTDLNCPANSGNLACGQRTETRADGAKRVFQYGSVASPNTESYTDFAKPSETHHTTRINYTIPASDNPAHYLRTITDARENATSTEKTNNTGAIMAVIHPNLSRRSYLYTDADNPYYLASEKDENDHITYYDRYGAPGFPPDPLNPNRIWRIQYPDLGWEAFTYNHFGQVLWHRMTSGGEETFTYNTRGLKETYIPPVTPSDETPWANPTRYFYYTSGLHTDRPQYVQDPRGNTTEYQYNSRGLVTKVIHPGGTFIESEYNADGTLRWTEDELRHRTTYTYDEYKRVTEVKNHLDESVTKSYGPTGGNPLWHTTSSVYRAASHLQKVTEYDYDSNFRVKWMTVAPGTNDAATTNYITYDAVGNLTRVEDPRHKFTTYGYDERNQQTSILNEDLDETTRVVFDDAGNKKREERPDEAFRTWDYDSMNRLWHAYDWRTTEEPTANQTTTYQNDHSGNVLFITDTKNAVYSFLYDELNRKKSATYPGDATVPVRTETWRYDVAGNLILHKNPADQYRHFVYDERNRQRRSYWNMLATFHTDTVPNWSVGPEITTTPDAASRIIEVKTNDGETIVGFGYDAANRQVWEDQTVDGRTRRVTTLRDQDGRRTSLEIGDPPIEGGNLTVSPEMSGGGSYSISYQYTERNQLLHIIGNAGENWSFTYVYDKGGNMTSRQADYNNQRTWTKCPDGYDALNRPRSWEQSGPNGVYASSHYQYDRANREEATWRAEDNHRGERFEYEITNQLKKVSYGINITPTPGPPSPTPPNATPTPPNGTPTPPPPGQVAGVVMVEDGGYPDILNVTMTTATEGATIFYQIRPDHHVNPTHNNNGQPTNGTATYNGTPAQVAAGQLRYIRAVAWKAGSIDSVMNDHTADNTNVGGEVPSAPARVVTYTHTLDKLSRGSMNDSGVVTNYAPNALNQYTSTAGSSFSYDNNFNMTHSAGFNGVYNAANRLVLASNGGSGEAQTTLASFVYDGLGRCVKRTLGDVATVFIYDGWKPVAEWDAWAEYFQAWNAYGPGQDEILLRQDAKMGYLRFQLDRHGNVAFLLDNDAALIEKYTYDVFGLPKITDATGTVVRSFSHYEHNFLFQGREYIRQLGIYDFRNRFYSPTLGRFIQTDPIGLQTEGAKLSAQQRALYVGGGAPETFGSSELNLYRYGNGDPVNGSDPFGLDAEFTLMRDPYVSGANANPRLSAGIMSITENGKFMGSMRVNAKGFESGRQGIPAGRYVVLPKAEDGRFPKGTPAVTSPSLKDQPGATTAGHKQGDVLIHGEGKKEEPDSRACITCGPAGLKLATDVFNRNKDSTTMKVYNGPKVSKPNEIPRAIPVPKKSH